MTTETAKELLQWLGPWALPLMAAYFVIKYPDNTQKVAGWFASGLARFYRRADKTAVALRVQGEINSSRGALLRNAPTDVIEGKIAIAWNDAETAEAVLRGGDVVVFMKRSPHQAENVTTALMAYLPKAVLPRARRYLHRDTLRAIELTIARSMLAGERSVPGALDLFFDQHLDPIRQSDTDLSKRLDEIDEIDLQGWLTRILLSEYRRLGNLMYPGDPDPAFVQEAEQFAAWVHEVGMRPRGTKGSLFFNGRYFNVGIVLVAARTTFGLYGLEPYVRRVEKLYADNADVVFLVARDANIATVRDVVVELEKAGRTAEITPYKYRLRADFKARLFDRDFAICVALRPDRGVDHVPAATSTESTAAEAELLAEVREPVEERTASPATLIQAAPSADPAGGVARTGSAKAGTTDRPEPAPVRESAPRRPPLGEVHALGDQVQGVIKRIPPGQEFGFIVDTCAHTWFFSKNGLAEPARWRTARRGETVTFRVGRNNKGLCARDVAAAPRGKP